MPPKKSKEVKEVEDRLKERLIAKVSQYPILYDKENERYFDTKEKEEIWRIIAKELGCTSTEINRKWKGLRDAYVREKRCREQPSGSAATKRKTFPYFDGMSFLEPYVRKRRSISTVDDESEEESQKTQEEDNMVVLGEHTFDMNETLDRLTVQQFTELINDVSAEKSDVPSISESSRQQSTVPAAQETPSTSKVIEPSKKSKPMQLVILSPKKEKSYIHERKSKVKMEAEVSEGINKIVSSLETQLMPKTLGDEQEILLGQEIGKTLLQIPNKIVRNKWKRKFREMLSDLEDEVTELEEGSL